MSLYHSFRKTGKKKEISNRPRSGPIPAYYMPTSKQGCKKSIPVLMVRQAGIEPAAFTFGVCYSIP